MTDIFHSVERLAILETKLQKLEDSYKEIDRKLDELLTMRDKGIGAFWLASALLGTGIVGFITTFVSWIRHM